MNNIVIPYKECRNLIKEGDILLFSGTSIVSRIIKRVGDGNYSHVGVASWHNGGNKEDALLECVEFSEKFGGRTTNLNTYLGQDSRRIDVFRPIPRFTKWVFNPETRTTELFSVEFNGKLVTRAMRKMTGLPYGWKRIYWIAKRKLPILRLFYDINSSIIDRQSGAKEIIYPVCSTAIAYAFNSNNYDLVYQKSDEWTEPSDIARSTRLNYLFTIGR